MKTLEAIAKAATAKAAIVAGAVEKAVILLATVVIWLVTVAVIGVEIGSGDRGGDGSGLRCGGGTTVVFANTANVIRSDVPASNGVNHIIDKVIFPLGIDIFALLILDTCQGGIDGRCNGYLVLDGDRSCEVPMRSRCSICGSGRCIQNTASISDFPGQPDILRGDLKRAGYDGIINSIECGFYLY